MSQAVAKGEARGAPIGVASLGRSTIGLKVVMAVTGLILFGFIIGHLLGNLLVFKGQQAIDAYARWLREHLPLLWTARAVLLAAVVAHVMVAIRLTVINRSARPVGYAVVTPVASTYAGRTMIISGPLIALYVVYHILHFTLGVAHMDLYEEGYVYSNMVRSFQVPLVAGVYIAAMLMLGLHLEHGMWSMLQTVGLNHPRYDRRIRGASFLIAVAITVGYIAIPVSILAGWVR